MSERAEPGENGFEDRMLGDGGEVRMPSSAAPSRGVEGTPLDQDVAEEEVGKAHRVVEGYLKPGESHTD